MKNSILQINSSGRTNGSLTRLISNRISEILQKKQSGSRIVERELKNGLPFVDQPWIGATFTNLEDRTDQQHQLLAFSDKLVEEVQSNDYLVVGVPVYNFSIPAVLKAWIDLICRAGLTFRYTSEGPEGLIENKKAYLVAASGGIDIGGEYDLATKYLKLVFAFIGITQVEVIDASQLVDADHEPLESVKIEQLLTL